jgi:hypothetical protein
MTIEIDHPAESAGGTPTPRGRLLHAWQILTCVLGVSTAVLVTLGLAQAPRALVSGAQPTQLALGYNYTPSHFGRLPARRVTGFFPGSPLPQAGVEAGDLIVDAPRGALLPGEEVALQIVHAGAVRGVEVRPARIEPRITHTIDAFEYALDALMLAVAIVVALRRRREIAALALACALFLATSVQLPDFFAPGLLARLTALCVIACAPFVFAAVAYCLVAFEGGYRSRARPYIVRALILFCAAWGLWSAVILAPYLLGWVWIALDAALLPVRSAADIAVMALCVWALVDTWRHTTSAVRRQRLRWLLFAIVVAIAGFALTPAQNLGAFGDPSEPNLFAGICQDLVFGASVLILSYAIVRHRVLDVGLVISRTLVFSAFTGLLLLVFGALEWLLSHFLDFEQRQRSFWLDGVLAVGVYVAFHRVRHWLERVVERVFFHQWHVKEVALNHFLDTAPHYSDPEALAEAFLRAVDAYAGSRGSGIYRQDERALFILEKSTLAELPRELGADAPVIVELKTDHMPYRFGRLALASATLAVPVIRRSELVGFLAVGEKGDRTLYRQDEIDNLVRAVHQVSSDLSALRVERLERSRQELEQQNEALRRELRLLARSAPSS